MISNKTLEYILLCVFVLPFYINYFLCYNWIHHFSHWYQSASHYYLIHTNKLNNILSPPILYNELIYTTKNNSFIHLYVHTHIYIFKHLYIYVFLMAFLHILLYYNICTVRVCVCVRASFIYHILSSSECLDIYWYLHL